MTDFNGGYERGVAAHEDAVFDHCLVLVYTVVITGDGAGPNVYARSHFCVSEICEVIGLRSAAKAYFLRLDEVAHVRSLPNFASWPQMRVGTDDCGIRDRAFIDDGSGAHRHMAPDLGIADNRVGSNAAVFANNRVAQYLDKRLNRSVGRDAYVVVDHARIRSKNRYPLTH